MPTPRNLAHSCRPLVASIRTGSALLAYLGRPGESRAPGMSRYVVSAECSLEQTCCAIMFASSSTKKSEGAREYAVLATDCDRSRRRGAFCRFLAIRASTRIQSSSLWLRLVSCKRRATLHCQLWTHSLHCPMHCSGRSCSDSKYSLTTSAGSTSSRLLLFRRNSSMKHCSSALQSCRVQVLSFDWSMKCREALMERSRGSSLWSVVVISIDGSSWTQTACVAAG